MNDHRNPHRDRRPGIFWTWQDRQVEDRAHVEASVDDMVEHGFGTLLLQPRGCRYPVDDPAFVEAVVAASQRAADRGAALWLHLDPRSMARPLLHAGAGASEYLVVAGTGDEQRSLPPHARPLDAAAPIAGDGAFAIRLDYPPTRPYHVHSDGAIAFRPLRLLRCLAFRRDGAGLVDTGSLRDISDTARLFINELSGYVEVFGRWRPPQEEDWSALALVSFGSNYPDYASPEVRAGLARAVDRYAAAGARLAGLWWDEPGYCTGFDRSFRFDRGRLPWGDCLARLHRRRTGRDPLDDALHLLLETDDGQWGERREEYYRTLEEAVFGAQRELHEHARNVLGEEVRLGVHQTWHQNADDVINGCMDWWRGARLLGAGFADVGDAERVDLPSQMAEVTAMGAIAVSLGRRSERQEAYYNLWGVEYGGAGDVPGPGLLDWWVDLQATLGCNWLAHTYGPTGYFERPPAWGPGYPHHPTWTGMKSATERLTRALELAEGVLPSADVALVYPLGTLFRLGSDLANPLAQGTHALIDRLLRAGFEVDALSPEALREEPAERYRAVIYLHPFGASPADVEDLARRTSGGAALLVAGLPPVAGGGYAPAAAWRERLELTLPEASWPLLPASQSDSPPTLAGRPWPYRGVPGWGRPLWSAAAAVIPPAAGEAPRTAEFAGATPALATAGSSPTRGGTGRSHYLGLLLEGIEEAPGLLARLGIEPSWRLPSGALGSRTDLPDGATLLRLCPARFGLPFHGIVRTNGVEIEVGSCPGLLCLRLEPGGEVREEIAPSGCEWRLLSPRGDS